MPETKFINVTPKWAGLIRAFREQGVTARLWVAEVDRLVEACRSSVVLPPDLGRLKDRKGWELWNGVMIDRENGVPSSHSFCLRVLLHYAHAADGGEA